MHLQSKRTDYLADSLVESTVNHNSALLLCAHPQDVELPMKILNHFSETRLARRNLPVALLIGALLTGASFSLHADEFQDANQLFKQGKHSQAMTKVDNYLASKPKDAQGRFLKGLIYTEQNQIPEAIKIFSDLTRDYPELPEPYNNLAVLYASQGQYDKARTSLEMAIRTHPSYATAHENLGDIYAKMASQAYNRALQLDSGNTATQTKLAMIQDLFSDKPASRSSATRNTVNTPLLIAVAPTAAAKPVATGPAKVAATAPAAKASATPAASNSSGEVLAAVDAWAAAWSSKNVKQYLSHYTADFHTPNGESHSAWAANRKERITKPKNIDVRVSKASVKFTDDNHATVRFHQDYRASNFKASSSKTLNMVKSGGNWLIQEENAN